MQTTSVRTEIWSLFELTTFQDLHFEPNGLRRSTLIRSKCSFLNGLGSRGKWYCNFDYSTMCAKSHLAVWKIVVKNTFHLLGVLSWSLSELLQKFYSYVLLLNVSTIHPYSMISSRSWIFHTFAPHKRIQKRQVWWPCQPHYWTVPWHMNSSVWRSFVVHKNLRFREIQYLQNTIVSKTSEYSDTKRMQSGTGRGGPIAGPAGTLYLTF